MTGRPPPGPSEPGRALPVLDRIAPAPPQSLVVSLIDGHTGAGDIVADPFGRGGWIARAGLDRQRRVVSLESSPLTRMLAEVVLRPPDVRHLDAAFQGIAASPRRRSSLKVSLGDMFATRCATCGRTLVADEVVWGPRTMVRRRAPSPSATAAPCRDQRGGGEQREGELDAEDLDRATADVGAAAVRRELAERFPRSTVLRISSTSCSTCIRLASSSGLPRSWRGSRATCARHRCSPRSAWRCSTRSCRPAG